MFLFSGELGFLNCNNICMCIVNKQFVLLECVLILFMLTCSMMRFPSLLLLGLCGVCSHLIKIFGVSVRLFWYPVWLLWLYCML